MSTKLCDRLAWRTDIKHQLTDFVIYKSGHDFNFKTIRINDAYLLQPFVSLIKMSAKEQTKIIVWNLSQIDSEIVLLDSGGHVHSHFSIKTEFELMPDFELLM